MSVELNHIIVPAHDKRASAEFLAGILGVPVGTPWGPFVPLELANRVTLDYMDAAEFHAQHCAFLVSDAEFDQAFGRIRAEQITFYADPHLNRPGETNERDGSRGLYFVDPAGHLMEIMTPPAGSG